ncbi:hypothetical protein [Streptacidiphilus sp. MAP5-52]|uniref:hypothetical protein n=1 Tax=Streptacidiphilus sp. MAP5-52 TaxID=3156267 RepID=UPI003514E33C
MTQATDALSLHDQAAGIERLRFELRTVPDPLVSPAQASLARHLHTLSDLVGQVAGQVATRGHQQWPVPHTDPVTRAFEAALSPLNAAQNELVHALQLAAPKDKPGAASVEQAAAHLLRHRVSEADAALQRAAGGLRAAADELVPAQPRRRDVAMARSARTIGSAFTPASPATSTAVASGPTPGPARASR